MPKFISDEDMEKLDAAQPKTGFISDDDMAALESVHQRPTFGQKIASIPSSIVQTIKTLGHANQEVPEAIQNPGEALDVAARGAASGASYLDIPEPLKLEAEKVIAKNLPTALGGMTDEEYQNAYGNRNDQDLINQNMIHEARERAKFPALDLASRGAGFAAGTNPASMILKTGTQSASRALNEGESLPSALQGGAEDALIQAGMTYGPRAIAKIPSALNKASDSLKSTAERFAENATGATGIQKGKFREGTGRELLDRGIVSFYDDPAAIAEKAAAAQEQAGQVIQSALDELDAKGVKASLQNVSEALNKKIADLESTPGNESLVSKLQGEVENLNSRMAKTLNEDLTARSSEVPLSTAEQAKRNFQGSVNYFSPQADQKAAFHSADAFRNEVERAAEAADPEIAQKFKTAKETYGLLAPVEEAAAKRANQLDQHPVGGLGDMAAAATTGLAHGPMAAGVAAKRVLFPRISSSLAATTDWLSKKLKTDPNILGKYTQPLINAASRGGQALGVTHYLLQSTDPEYQQLMQNIQDNNTNEGP